MFDDAFQFFDEAKENNSTIFVHCQMGKSRSSSFVIAYIMKSLKMSFEDAYKLVKNARKLVFPNLGFVRQLREYGKTLESCTSSSVDVNIDSIKN